MRQVDFDQNSPCGSHESTAQIDSPTKSHEEFPYDEMDKPEDIVRERLVSAIDRMDEGNAALEIIEELARKRADEIAWEHVKSIIAMIYSERKPILFLDCMRLLSGVGLVDGMSEVTLARRHGVSKQAIQQYLETIRGRFKFPKLRTERSEDAKEAMRQAYVKK